MGSSLQRCIVEYSMVVDNTQSLDGIVYLRVPFKHNSSRTKLQQIIVEHYVCYATNPESSISSTKPGWEAKMLALAYRFLFGGFAGPFCAQQFNIHHFSLASGPPVFFMLQIFFASIITVLFDDGNNMPAMVYIINCCAVLVLLNLKNLVMSSRRDTGCGSFCCTCTWFKQIFLILKQLYVHCIFQSPLNTL